MQPALISFPQKVNNQVFTHRWWARLRFKEQAVILAKTACLATLTTFLTLLVLANKTSAYGISNQSITAQLSQSEQTESEQQLDTRSTPPTKPPLFLVIQTGVGALLLVGLISAYLANRARSRVLTSDAILEEKWGKQEEQTPEYLAFARLATEFVQNQGTLPEDQDEVAQVKQLTREISLRLRQSPYSADVLKTAVKEVRRALKADRVYFYCFNPDWSGVVVAESVAPGWPSCLRIKVTDTYFSQSPDGVEKYKNGCVWVKDDIYKAGLTDCHLKLLEQFAIKAQIVTPILKNNQLFALMVVDQCAEPRQWRKHEVSLLVELAQQVGFAIEQVSFLENQEAEAERAQLITEFTLLLRESLYLEDVFKTAVKEIRRTMKTDRVVIFTLEPNQGVGNVVAESVGPGWPQTLRVKIDDPCLKDRYLQLYSQGQITSINDIYQDPRVTDCYRNMLEQFAVKANLVAPILQSDKLFGLMITHQCDRPRNWQKHEVDLFAQMVTQVGFALAQVSLQDTTEHTS